MPIQYQISVNPINISVTSNVKLTFPPLSIDSWTFFKKSLSLHLFESRMVVAYVDSEIRMSGRHLSIHAALYE